jgi:hypothetical protein
VLPFGHATHRFGQRARQAIALRERLN